ncbi:MGMT family protein [Aestuariimicrobium ganziense]|uniref:MGMT family protein n=1 Tax=Aestuariimicrobium ganziense TaxID=2773677 RepID=UPI0019438159|nr:MGMT family protein [Aestuariimicrobium ganziense]
MPSTPSDLVERVLLAVELVPAGQVVSYGDLAELCGTSPRRVGAIMRDHGHEVAWWRVLSHSGDHPLIDRALPYWHDEQIAVKPNGLGCRISEYRTNLVVLATRYEQQLARVTMEP